VSTSGTRSVAPRTPGLSAPVAAVPAYEQGTQTAGAIMGAAMGLVGTAAAAAGAVRRSRVQARVGKGQPSLIQVAEQKKLLSTVEGLGLLSKAEQFGISIATPEKLGLLKFAEEKGLLTFAENVLTSPSTPITLLIAAGAGVAGVYLDLTEGSGSFFNWVLAGAFGVPALICLGAALVIFALFGGVKQTKNLNLSEKVSVYSATGGQYGKFSEKTVSRPVTLLSVAEEKGLLSFAEEYGLLSLAAQLVDKPLTLTERLRVLSQLERSGLLSTVESSASDKFGAASYGTTGLLFITAAVAAAVAVPDFGTILALLLALPGLGYLAVGLGFAVVQPPRRT
jgi:hypothetical protein